VGLQEDALSPSVQVAVDFGCELGLLFPLFHAPGGNPKAFTDAVTHQPSAYRAPAGLPSRQTIRCRRILL
jgi:hypothetical protein